MNDMTLEAAVSMLRSLLTRPESEGYRDAIRFAIVEATGATALRVEIERLKLWLEQAQTERDDLRERVGDLVLAAKEGH
jgi:hypothetical protein